MMQTESDRDILLDGEWQIVFDERNRGKAEGWHRLQSPPDEAVPIHVPSCWEEVKPGYDGVAWYWRTFHAWRQHPDDRILLRFEAVNYFAEVYVDGHHVGNNEGGYTPFTLDISEWVRDAADHTLTVRVLTPPRDEEGIDGIVLKETPCWRTWESFNIGGIWQSVHLLNLPAVCCEDCFVEPAPDLTKVLIHVTAFGAATDGPVTLECALFHWKERERKLATVGRSFESLSDLNKSAIELAISNPEHWSPDHPRLYWLEATLDASVNGRQVRDRTGVRFGLRWLDFKENRFILNGRPIFIKGGFHEGLYPIGLARPTSRQFVEEELKKAKDCGFNLLRYWQIPIHPTVLDVADEVGIMLMDEPPIEWMTQTDQTARRCRDEVERLVRRDRNRPSVVIWTILNEGGIAPDYNRRNFGSFTRQEWDAAPVQRERENLCLLARSLDPTRLIIDDSGGWVVGANVYLPHSDRKTRLNDCHAYRRAPTTEADLTWLNTVGSRSENRGHLTTQAGVGVFMSEFGYGSFPDFEAVLDRYREHGARPDLEDVVHHRTLLDSLRTGFEANRMDRFYPDVRALCEATQINHGEGNAMQTLALRANPLVVGYVMHAFSAGGCILGAELFDTWRGEKLVARHVAEAQEDHVLAVFLERRTVMPGEAVKVRVVSVCDGDLDHMPTCEMIASVSSPRGDVATRGFGKVDLKERIQTIWEGEIPLGASAGEYQLTFELRAAGRTIATGTRKAFVIAPVPIPGDWALCVIGSGGDDLERIVTSLGIRCVRSPAKATHVIVATQGTVPTMPFGYREIAAGGRTLLVLAPWPQGIQWTMNCFNIPGEIAGAVGNWSPVCHYIENRDLQSNLPSDILLGQAYADVLPVHCIRTSEGRALASCVSYLAGHIFTKQTEVWWGKTIMEKRFGEGRLIVCTFQIGGTLAKDPLSRNLFVNLLGLSKG